MRLLVLNRYSRQGASSRLRTMQYSYYLSQNEIRCEFVPFYGEDYLHSLYAGRPVSHKRAKAYYQRISLRKKLASADAIWIEKEVLPWCPYAFENLFIPPGVPLIIDYDDAIFHRYDLHRSPLIRWVLGRKIDNLMKRSDTVIAGNKYLADRAIASGATNVEIVPTVVDLARYSIKEFKSQDEQLKIGWIGSPSTWQEYMKTMLPMLHDVIKTNNAQMIVVGAKNYEQTENNVYYYPWIEDLEAKQIKTFDIGIMPLTNTPWALGKCGYKLIQYMACGIPVVASPVGVNCDIVEHGVNGFLASDENEWKTALTTLLCDRDLREKMGGAARRKIEKNYSLANWEPAMKKIIETVIVHGR